jgi:hypothetical protein
MGADMPQLPDTIDTELLLEAHIDIAPAETLGTTPFGTRSIYTVAGGTFEGPKLRGTFRPGGGDWMLILPNGAGELDVRGTMQTDDGALIYISYHGVIDVAPATLARVLGGEDVSPSEYYLRTAPRLETGAEKYAWLNKTVCIGTGYFAPSKVGYRIFAVK